jgi:hypothetical protein
VTVPAIDTSFPHSWTAEILPGRPMILPSRHFTYPEVVDEVEKGALEAMIHPQDAQPFLATCALGFRDPTAPTGLWAMPHPEWLCAVSGGYAYLIDTTQPERFTMIRYRPVLQIISARQSGLLLFAGHNSILAWGANGEAWESERLSWEGLTGLRIEAEALYGQGWDLMTDKDVPFALDLRSGKRL